MIAIEIYQGFVISQENSGRWIIYSLSKEFDSLDEAKYEIDTLTDFLESIS